MKRLALLLALISSFTLAAPNPEPYPLSVHVISSHPVFVETSFRQQISVTIDGKHYELLCSFCKQWSLLFPGDYKARIKKDKHTSASEIEREYELLLPDNTAKTYWMVGHSEN